MTVTLQYTGDFDPIKESSIRDAASFSGTFHSVYDTKNKVRTLQYTVTDTATGQNLITLIQATGIAFSKLEAGE